MNIDFMTWLIGSNVIDASFFARIFVLMFGFNCISSIVHSFVKWGMRT